jgi:hypothetical protein
VLEIVPHDTFYAFLSGALVSATLALALALRLYRLRRRHRKLKRAYQHALVELEALTDSQMTEAIVTQGAEIHGDNRDPLTPIAETLPDVPEQRETGRVPSRSAVPRWREPIGSRRGMAGSINR